MNGHNTGPGAKHDTGGTTEHTFSVVARHELYAGPVFSLVSDEVAMPGGGTARRDYTRNRGAVAVVALDDLGRVVLVRQYRHPIGRRLWELPAGMMDMDGETPLATAQRELAEEVHLVAGQWDLLVDLHPSPGVSTEIIHVFLARQLAPVAEGVHHQREHEEAELTSARVDLDEAVQMTLRGEITNGPAVAGILAAARCRDLGWSGLRPASVTGPPAAPPAC